MSEVKINNTVDLTVNSSLSQQTGKSPIADIWQSVEPSPGTKLVCTECGREDWHTLILRRRRGLIEGLCKQIDGSGCFPNNPRVNCMYVDENQINCIQLSEWEIWDPKTSKTITLSCADHLGRQVVPNCQVSPVSD